MKTYCLDTSGLSNPLVAMPEDIHPSLWRRIEGIIEAGRLAVTAEIHDELTHLEGSIGDCIRTHKAELILEVAKGDWDWLAYIAHGIRMQADHHDYIAEYNGNRRSTVGLTDITIVALAKTLALPLISMESSAITSSMKRRIPDVCHIEGVEHLTFNDFLRREGVAV